MLSHSLEIPSRGRLQRIDHISLKKIRACGKGDGVWDLGFEIVGLCLDQVEGFVDGGYVAVNEKLDECFDGGDGHGEIGVFCEEVVVCFDDAGERV